MLEFSLKEEVNKRLVEVEGMLLVVEHNNFEEDEGWGKEEVAKGGEVDVLEHLEEEEEEEELNRRVPVIVVRQRCVEENTAEMALSKDERESVIRRSPKEIRRSPKEIRRSPKERARKAQRILLDPREEQFMLLLDPREDQTQLKPSHHSTPLLPTDLGMDLGLYF